MLVQVPRNLAVMIIPIKQGYDGLMWFNSIRIQYGNSKVCCKFWMQILLFFWTKSSKSKIWGAFVRSEISKLFSIDDDGKLKALSRQAIWKNGKSIEIYWVLKIFGWQKVIWRQIRIDKSVSTFGKRSQQIKKRSWQMQSDELPIIDNWQDCVAHTRKHRSLTDNH